MTSTIVEGALASVDYDDNYGFWVWRELRYRGWGWLLVTNFMRLQCYLEEQVLLKQFCHTIRLDSESSFLVSSAVRIVEGIRSNSCHYDTVSTSEHQSLLVSIHVDYWTLQWSSTEYSADQWSQIWRAFKTEELWDLWHTSRLQDLNNRRPDPRLNRERSVSWRRSHWRC